MNTNDKHSLTSSRLFCPPSNFRLQRRGQAARTARRGRQGGGRRLVPGPRRLCGHGRQPADGLAEYCMVAAAAKCSATAVSGGVAHSRRVDLGGGDCQVVEAGGEAALSQRLVAEGPSLLFQL